MAWITPKTDWVPADGIDNADLNRIEENINQLQTGGKGVDSISAGPDYVPVKWKKFTGTTDSDGVTEFAHGVTGTIYNVWGSYLGTTQNFQIGGYDGINAVWGALNWDTTDIQMRVSSIGYSKPYSVIVMYTD